MANVYKSKKGIMPAGLLAIAVAVSIAGCLLSFVYLKINQVCPVAELCGLIALGFGALMGGIAFFLIKHMKIRSKTTALIGIIIGCFVFTVFKWALYVQWDNEKFIKNKPMAWDYCEFYYDFSNDGELSSEIMSKADIKSYMADMTKYSAYEYFETLYPGGASAYIKDIKEANGTKTTIKELKNTNSFDYFYKDYVIKGKEVECIIKAYDMTTKEYLEYIGKYPDVKYLLTHPKEFFDDIKFINGYGRWSIGSRASAIIDSEKNNNVKGFSLWVVWIAEILIICIPAVLIACKRAEKPFIESENQWATLNESDGFMLTAPVNSLVAATSFKTNPDSIFTYPHLNSRPGLAPYMKLKLYHSKGFDENYACLSLYTYVPKNKNYSEKMFVKYVAVDKDFVSRFYQHCGLIPPFAYTPVSTTEAPTMEAINDPMDIFNASFDEVKSMATTSSGMMEEVSSLMADEKSQEDVLSELNS